MEARLLSTAIIGKTHGVDGYLKLHSLSGEYRHLMKIRKCTETSGKYDARKAE